MPRSAPRHSRARCTRLRIGADRTIAGLRRFLVREARVTNCDQSLAHLLRQLQQRGSQIGMFHVCNLGWAGGQRLRVSAVDIRDLLSPPATLVVEPITENCDEPRQHLRSGVEQLDLVPGEQQRLLNQIVRMLYASERDGKSTKPRYRCDHRLANGTVRIHAVAPGSIATSAGPCRRLHPCCSRHSARNAAQPRRLSVFMSVRACSSARRISCMRDAVALFLRLQQRSRLSVSCICGHIFNDFACGDLWHAGRAE